MYKKYIIDDKKRLRRIEKALLETYFLNYDQEFLKTESGRLDIDANVFQRYNNSLQHVVPWVAKHIDLQGKSLVEVGCGTGSSTAAFANFVQKIDGYDIDDEAVKGAKQRLEIMGLSNATLWTVSPEQLVATLKEKHSDGVDVILLFAVLEHQTVKERLDTLKTCWQLVNPGGLLVVTETPNLLTYMDSHTSILPFLHMLPSELYAQYATRSPREGFDSAFFKINAMSRSELDTSIMRWGRGVSYHDFELAMGKEYGSYLVASGFEKEMLSWFEVSLEEELLRHFFLVEELDVPLAFSRVVLNVIFKKNEKIKKEVDTIPKNKFISDMYTVTEQEIYINTLKNNLAANEQQLNDILSSRRWRMVNLVATPYRIIKSFFSHP